MSSKCANEIGNGQTSESTTQIPIINFYMSSISIPNSYISPTPIELIVNNSELTTTSYFSTNESQNKQSTSHDANTLILPTQRSLKSVFENVIKCPVQQVSKSKRKRKYTPSVITSDKRVEYHELKEIDKLNKDEQR